MCVLVRGGVADWAPWQAGADAREACGVHQWLHLLHPEG